jgi:hypothetical protein
MQKKSAESNPQEGPKKGFAGRAPLADMHTDETTVLTVEELRRTVAANASEGPVSAEHVKDVLSALPKEEKK